VNLDGIPDRYDGLRNTMIYLLDLPQSGGRPASGGGDEALGEVTSVLRRGVPEQTVLSRP